MRLKAVRHRAEHAFFRAVRRLLLLLPHAVVRRFGRGLGDLGWRLGRRHRRLALANVALALPELTEGDRQRVVRDCFRHFGGYFAEVLSAARFGREELGERFEVAGWEHVEEAEQSGRGYFLTTGHFGCWELAIYPLSQRIEQLQVVARPPNNPYVERDLRQLRERFGAAVIDKAGAGHRMLNAFRRGARIAIVIDQHVRQSAGIQVPFFGHPAWTSPVLAFLSLHTRAPVIHFSCEPLAEGRYRLTLRPPIPPDAAGDATGAAAQAILTRCYMAEVEHDIRRRPEMWLWMHRRWRP